MIQNKKIYIITGSVGTGKSTLLSILAKKGFLVIDSDKIVHDLYKEQNIINELVKKFGHSILENGKINRSSLGQIVFKDETKKTILENIVHPKVVEEISKIISATLENIIFIEIPLYYKVERLLLSEIRNYKLIVMSIDKDKQVNRLMDRNNISKEDALLLMENMKKYMVFSKEIDYIIMNNEDEIKLEKIVNELILDERLNESI